MGKIYCYTYIHTFAKTKSTYYFLITSHFSGMGMVSGIQPIHFKYDKEIGIYL